MPGTHHMTQADRMCLNAAAYELHDQYRGVLGEPSDRRHTLSAA
jgi:hypothetical protein